MAMHQPRPLIGPGGPSYKVLVCCDAPDGMLLTCVVVPYPPGAEPHSDVLEAAEFAAVVPIGEVIAADGFDPQGRPPRAGALVAFLVQPDMPSIVGRVGDVTTLPLFLGFRWEEGVSDAPPR
jgi:hypothetical protein